MLEAEVERRLKRLEEWGFKVLKLRTPGNNGVPDRMILSPKYSPRDPIFVELKRPGKSERLLQATLRDDWIERGCKVWPMCDTLAKVDIMVGQLRELVEYDRALALQRAAAKVFE